jgi:hypothetical protein
MNIFFKKKKNNNKMNFNAHVRSHAIAGKWKCSKLDEKKKRKKEKKKRKRKEEEIINWSKKNFHKIECHIIMSKLIKGGCF